MPRQLRVKTLFKIWLLNVGFFACSFFYEGLDNKINSASSFTRAKNTVCASSEFTKNKNKKLDYIFLYTAISSSTLKDRFKASNSPIISFTQAELIVKPILVDFSNPRENLYNSKPSRAPPKIFS